MEAVPTLPRETILMSTFIRLLCTEIPLGLFLQFVHSKRQSSLFHGIILEVSPESIYLFPGKGTTK